MRAPCQLVSQSGTVKRISYLEEPANYCGSFPPAQPIHLFLFLHLGKERNNNFLLMQTLVFSAFYCCSLFTHRLITSRLHRLMYTDSTIRTTNAVPPAGLEPATKEL